MACCPIHLWVLLVTSLVFVPSNAGLILNYNNTEHVLYPLVSSNFHGTTPDLPAPLVAPVHIISRSDLQLIEELSCKATIQTNTSFPFTGMIIVVPITWREQYYPHCGISLSESEYASEVDKLDWICSQGVLAIVVEKQFFEQTNVATVQDWHKPFNRWPNLIGCDTYRVAVQDSIALPFTGKANITGRLSWDPDPFLSFFQAPAVLYLYRPVLTASYLAVALLAAKHLWQRYRRENLNIVFTFLLVSAFITMLILSVATGFGIFLVWGWQSTFHLFFQVSHHPTTSYLAESLMAKNGTS